MALSETMKAELKALAVAEAANIKKSAGGFQHPVPTVEDDVKTAVEKAAASDFRIGRLLRGMVTKSWEGCKFERDVVEKAAGSFSGVNDQAGGYLVPAERSQEVINYLSPSFAVRALGPDIVPMASGTLELPKDNGGITSSYAGENSTQTAQKGALGMVKLTARKLITLAAIPNELIMDSSPAAEAVIRKMLTRAMGLKETEAALLGAGGVSPVGLINWAGITTATPVAASSLTYDNLIDLMGAVEEADGIPTGFVFTPSIAKYLRKIKSATDGHYVYTEGTFGKMATLFDLPASKTTQFKDLTTSTTHYIACGDFQGQFVIGERQGLEFTVSTERYFDNDQTAVKVVARHDFVARNEAAFAVLAVTSVA